MEKAWYENDRQQRPRPEAILAELSSWRLMPVEGRFHELDQLMLSMLSFGLEPCFHRQLG